MQQQDKFIKEYDIAHAEDPKKIVGCIRVPTHAKGVLFSQYVVMSQGLRMLNDYQVNATKEDSFSKSVYVRKIKNVLNQFYDFDFSNFAIGLEKSDYSKIRLDLYGLWNYTQNLVFSYKVKARYEGKNKLTINGKQYFIPAFVKNRVLNNDRNPKISTQQMIESLMIEEKIREACKPIDMQAIVKAHGKDVEGWIYVSEVTFVENLKKIALVMLQKDEVLPTSEYEYAEWLDSRYVEFEKISMVDALDTIFFLGGTPKN